MRDVRSLLQSVMIRPRCSSATSSCRREVAAVFEEARRGRILAMEAMWTLCLPVYRQVRAWLAAGLIGERASTEKNAAVSWRASFFAEGP